MKALFCSLALLLAACGGAQAAPPAEPTSPRLRSSRPRGSNERRVEVARSRANHRAYGVRQIGPLLLARSKVQQAHVQRRLAFARAVLVW